MQGFVSLITDVFEVGGAGLGFAQGMEGWVEEAEFVDVEEKVFDLWLGRKNGDPRLGRQRALSTVKSIGVGGVHEE